MSQATTTRRRGMSNAFLDPSTLVWTASDGESLVSYRRGWQCAVALGDPLCPEARRQAVATEFRTFCKRNDWDTVYALTSTPFADMAAGAGHGVMSFGEELVLDTADYTRAGGKGKELRNKLRRAAKDGVAVHVYAGRDPALEARLSALVGAWLKERKDKHTAYPDIDLFSARPLRRWLYATHGDTLVGVVAMLQLAPQQGYLLEHVLALPSAPPGTTELLIARSLDHLASAGIARATFGPAPAHDVAKNLPAMTTSTRALYARVARYFKLGRRGAPAVPAVLGRPAVHSNAVWLCFDPPVFAYRQVLAVMKAFHMRMGGDEGEYSPPPSISGKRRGRRTRSTPFGAVCTPIASGTVERTWLMFAAWFSSFFGLVSLSRFDPPPRQAPQGRKARPCVVEPPPLTTITITPVSR
ncbi:hypothetical protein Q8F55_009063 [Vanrija albida]|uniref:Phosphatidylglycerol lysyltransferase C-terminal domain-containing protein n=1 Tax=Vanrija albida TaxID=181172 RepID=A0ABR3PSK5_9TREE